MTFGPVTWTLGVDWGNVGSFTDEITRCQKFQAVFGRDSELGVAPPGRLTLTMRNDDGRFTPEYSSGALYPNCEIGRAVRLIGTGADASATSIFNGYITSIQPDPSSRKQCTVVCQDALTLFAKFHLNLALSTNKLSSDRISAIASAVAVPSLGTNIATGQQTFSYPHWRNIDALSAVQECADNELGGFAFIEYDTSYGKLAFQDRQYRARQTLAASFSNAFATQYLRRDDQVFTGVSLQATTYTAGVAGSQIWALLPLPVKILKGATLTLEANYATLSSPVTTPVAGTDYKVTVNQDGTGTDLTSSMVSAFTDYGGGATWTLTNNSPNDVWLQICQIRGTPLQLPTYLRTVTRTGSGTSPIARTYERSFRLVDDMTALGYYADYVITHYNTPQPMLVAQLEPITDAQYEQMVKRKLSDRVHVTDTQNAWSTQVDADFFIEKVQHDWDQASGHLRTQWWLTKYLADQAWVLGTSALGTDTILGW
jgi:hypothetical protein